MCTVTFVQTDDAFVMTSSRDEHVSRPDALPPQVHLYNGIELHCPIDPQAGGTWLVADTKGNAAILFNGAFEKHKHQPPYARSRGLVLMDLFSAAHPGKEFSAMNLEGIEPFSVILYFANAVQRLTWTGQERIMEPLQMNSPALFSSAPLYDESAKQRRSQWFGEYLNSATEISPEGIFSFHLNDQLGDRETGLIINRSNGLRTRSITQLIIGESTTHMVHCDIPTGTMHNHTYSLKR